MAVSSGSTLGSVTVLDELATRPYSFAFFVALRRLECHFRDLPRLGTAAHASEEPVRLGQIPSLSFTPAEIQGFDRADPGAPPRLWVAFFGLFGPHGALPIHLTEYARDRLRNAGDAAFARFVDVFHHRIYLLFYRAWAESQPTVAEDRPEQSRFRRYLGAVAGYGLPTLEKRDSIGDKVKWYYAGLLATANRSADGLRDLISDYFGLPVRIDEFSGEWVELPRDARFKLGGSAETSSLGRTSVIGTRVWLCQHRFRIVIGPVDREQQRRFLPGGVGLGSLVDLVRAYAGDELAWDVRLVLAPRATEQLRLGADARLGWNTRLGPSASGVGRSEDLIVDPAHRQTRRAISFAAAAVSG